MNKNFIVPLSIGILIIVAVIVFVLFKQSTQTSEDVPTPPGYMLSETGDAFVPEQTPEMFEVMYTTNGFPEEPINLTLPENNIPILFSLNNSTDSQLTIRLIRTPDGEWPEDPERMIAPQESLPLFLDKAGQYTIQNSQRQNQQLNIVVEKN